MSAFSIPQQSADPDSPQVALSRFEAAVRNDPLNATAILDHVFQSLEESAAHREATAEYLSYLLLDLPPAGTEYVATQLVSLLVDSSDRVRSAAVGASLRVICEADIGRYRRFAGLLTTLAGRVVDEPITETRLDAAIACVVASYRLTPLLAPFVLTILSGVLSATHLRAVLDEVNPVLASLTDDSAHALPLELPTQFGGAS